MNIRVKIQAALPAEIHVPVLKRQSEKIINAETDAIIQDRWRFPTFSSQNLKIVRPLRLRQPCGQLLT